ncbi:uncharacterized protein LOC116302971 [Actinia tenebrosa]|uniref:Uncharacterized protein LOC116302971 n=1 Tax=Actinia tenebrosa TaxID=6105 RepID=A0A6P8IN82_ACTTE|nr:uncharacterized protein LOC116302971 [Actinia tenebrosa]
MSSVGSRAEFPNRVYSPTPEDDFDNQELRPLNPHLPLSYEEMNGADDSYTREGQLHQYEDPRLLAEQMRRMNNSKIPPPCDHEIRPRKKANDLYERYRTDSDGSDSSKKSSRCRGAMCFLVTLSLMLALAAVLMAVLLVLGLLVPKSCENCLKNVQHSEGVPRTGTSASTPSTKHLEQMIKILQANLTQLHQIVRHRDDVIKKLMETDKSHTEQLNILFRNQLSDILKNARYNVTAQLKKELRGERGPRGLQGERGPPGEPGKPGSGNISTCVYKVAQVIFSPSRSSSQDVFAYQTSGWLIISATCSTDGAAQSNLRRVEGPNGIQKYSCQCKGIAVAHQGPATCFIHYWQCPKI